MIKAEDLTKRLQETERKMALAEERRQEHQRLLDHAFQKAGQAQAPSLKSGTKKPVPTRQFLGGGKITTLAWTPEKRLIQNQNTDGTTTTKWVPNRWQPNDVAK